MYDRATRTVVARIGGVTLQIVRDWVVKLNAHGPAGLIDRKPPGQSSRLNEAHRTALRAVSESGPTPAIHGVVPSGGSGARPRRRLHPAEIAAAVAPEAHAVLLVDQAGWHMSKKLAVPPNITLMPVGLRGWVHGF